MICSRCGATVGPDKKFCGQCGALCIRTAVQQVAEDIPQPQAPAVKPPQPRAEDVPQPQTPIAENAQPREENDPQQGLAQDDQQPVPNYQQGLAQNYQQPVPNYQQGLAQNYQQPVPNYQQGLAQDDQQPVPNCQQGLAQNYQQPVPNYQQGFAQNYQQPVYAQQQAATVKAPKQKKTPIPPTAGKKVLSVILCILCALLTVVTCNLGMIRETLSDKNLQYAVENFDASTAMVPVGDGTSRTLGELLYNNVDRELHDRSTPLKIANALNQIIRTPAQTGETKYEIVNIAKNFTRYLLNGDTLRSLDTDGLVHMVRENENVIYELTNYRLTTRDYDGLENSLESVSESLTVEGIKRSGVDPELIRILLSIWVYVALIVICAGLFVLVLWLNRGDLKACLKRIAPIWIVVGALFLAEFAGLVILRKEISATDALLKSPCISMLIRSLILLVLSILVLVLFRKKKKPGAVALMPQTAPAAQ